MSNIGVNVNSLMASAFLISSLYVLFRAGTASVGTAIMELGVIIAICICLYFSYRLIMVINRTMG